MAKFYLVGGYVRDKILGKEPHDKDYVVVGSTVEEMLELGYKSVGNNFPVFLHPQTGAEYALARKEIKTGSRHVDFAFDFSSNTTLKEDLLRRDLTINALAQDLETGEIIDYFDGLKDLNNRILRHVSPHFVEDPLRILRVLRFSCQLNFDIAPETFNLIQEMVDENMLAHLSSERIWKEIEKALHTPYFDKFLILLLKCGALSHIFPEVEALRNVPERKEYHPEGTAFKHLILTFKSLYDDVHACFGLHENYLEELSLINFGLLCHDLGKAVTDREKWPSHHEHETLGLPLVDILCERLCVPNKYRYFGKLACRYHMSFYQFLKRTIKSQYDFVKDITNFKDRKNMQLLLRLHKCDLIGRAGSISEDRIKTMQETEKRINLIYDIMENKSLKDLPEKTQQDLRNFKGEQFGKLYRDAMISYLKYNLGKKS